MEQITLDDPENLLIDGKLEKNQELKMEINSNEEKVQMGGYIGNLYQTKLCMLFLYRGLSLDYRFDLGTEIREAEKFDDIVFKYKDDSDDKDSFILVQAKHKIATDKIKLNEIMTIEDVNFGLVKYFNSYRKAKCNNAFKNGIIKLAIVYTNAQFDEDEKNPVWIEIKHDDHKNYDLLNLFKIENKGRFYKFKPDSILPRLKSMIMQYLCEYTKIAEKLVNALINGHTLMHTDRILKKYHRLLVAEVIDLKRKRFRDEFVEGQESDSAELKHFRKVLKSVFEVKELTLESIQEDVNKKFIVKKEFGLPIDKKNDDHQYWPEIKNIIEDYQILEFLDVVVFATDQPNEVELGNSIECELKEKHFFCDNFYECLNTVMINWTKGGNSETSKYTRTFGKIFISSSNAKLYFTEKNIEINQTVLKALRNEYFRKSIELNFWFDDPEITQNIQRFLRSRKNLMNVITKFVKLSTMKIVQILTFEDKSDYHIYVRLSTLNKPEDFDIVAKSFQNKLCSHSLLIIECDVERICNEKHEENLMKIFNILKDNTGKKIISISESNNQLFGNMRFQKKHCEIVEDNNTHFFNLTLDSQNELLDRVKVNFQESTIKLNELISDSSKYLINGQMLTNILNENEIIIGEMYKPFVNIKNYYIERNFFFEIDYDETTAMLKEFHESNFYAISEVSHNVSSQSQILKEPLLQNKIFPKKKRTKKYNIFIKNDNEFFVKQLNYSLDYNKINAELEKGIKNKIIVLVSSPGMGKSTVFNSLCENIKYHHPSSWVFKIDLNNISQTLKKIKEKRESDLNDLMKFLKVGLKLKTDFEESLFEIYLDKGKVILFFDGFDEISPTYKDLVIFFLKALIKRENIRIFVSTRPHSFIVKDLKKKLNATFCQLQPFEEKDQIEFLKKFWRNKMVIQHFDEKKFKIFTKELISEFKKNVNDEKMEFSGIAIHLMMIAETSYEIFERCHELNIKKLDDYKKQFGDILELSCLYDKFIEIKCYDIFYRDKNEYDISKDAVKSHVDKLYNDFVEKCMIMSVNSLFDDSEFNQILTESDLEEMKECRSDIEKSGEKYGMIVNVMDDRPLFVHKTFAEFFLAKFIVTRLIRDNEKQINVLQFFLETILKKENKNICSFINSSLTHDICEKIRAKIKGIVQNSYGQTLYFAIFNQWLHLIRFLILIGVDLNYTDNYGNTILHLAFPFGLLPRSEDLNVQNKIFELLLKTLIEKPDDLLELLKKQNCVNETPLDRAILYDSVKSVKTIMSFIDGRNQLNIVINPNSDSNILHLAARNIIDLSFLLKSLKGDVDLLKKLLCEENGSGFTPLMISVEFDEVINIIRLIDIYDELNMLDHISDMKKSNGNNILHIAAKKKYILFVIRDHLRYRQCLLKALILTKNKHDETPIQVALRFDCKKNVNILLELFDNLNILKIKINGRKINSNNILHSAAIDEDVGCLKSILENLKGHDDVLQVLYEMKNKSGKTPLDLAIEYKFAENILILNEIGNRLNEIYKSRKYRYSCLN